MLNMMLGIPRTAAAAALLLLAAGQVRAKGLDELAPEKGVDADKAEAAGDAPAEAEGQAAPAASAQAAGAAGFAVKREGAAFLNDKAFLETSFGIVRASAGKGDWRASGMSDVSFKYLVLEKPLSLYAKARYAPFDVTVYDQKIGYRGTVNGYYLGAESRFKVSSGLSLSADAELGLMAVYLYDVIDIASDPELEKNGVNFSLGGGADWEVAEHLQVGPRLHLGFGRFSLIQLGVAASLMF